METRPKERSPETGTGAVSVFGKAQSESNTSLNACCGFWDQKERTGYEPLAIHAPIQWAIQGDVIKQRG